MLKKIIGATMGGYSAAGGGGRQLGGNSRRAAAGGGTRQSWDNFFQRLILKGRQLENISKTTFKREATRKKIKDYF